MADYYFSDSIDLKLIILFIAENFKRPVTISDITDIVAETEYADYFPVAQGFSELLTSKLMISSSESGKYIVTKKGHDAYDLFSSDIPYTVKKTLLDAVTKKRRSESEAHSVTAEYKLNRAAQYDVFMEICETGIPIFSLSVTLPTLDDAKKAAAKFKKNADKIYSEIIKELT